MRRTRSRQVGRSVVSGATTPNRNGLVPRVAVVSGIVPVLSFDPGLLPGSCAIYERVRRFRQHRSESFGRGCRFGRSCSWCGEWRTASAGPCRSGRPGQVRLLDGWGAWTDSDVQSGSVDELLDVAVERPALDQLEVEVGRTLEDRVQPGLTCDDR